MRRRECGSNAMVTVQMTVGEYLEMKSRQETKEVTTKQKNLVYVDYRQKVFSCMTEIKVSAAGRTLEIGGKILLV